MPNDNTLLISQEVTFKKYYLSSLGANVAAFSIGTVLGYCSPALHSINQATSKIHLDTYEQSWFGSLVPLAALIGGLISGKTIETFGRKCTLLFASIPMLLGWLLICYAQDAWALFIGRFITGIALGLSNVAGPVYIAETTPAKTRGLFGLTFPLSMSLGVLYSYLIGYVKNWSYLALFCSIIPAVQMVFMFFLPETPSWLIKNNQVDQATETVLFLYGNDHNLLTLALLTDDEDNDNEKFKLFTEAKYRTPFVLCLIVMFYQQFCGINAVIFYTANILESAKSTIDPQQCTIYIGLVQFLTIMMSCFIVDRFGRKILLHVSGFAMGISMLLFSVYYFLDDTVKNSYGAFPLISLIFYVFSFAIGYGPVPWLLMSELIQTKVKGLASGLVTSFNFICMFVITFEFQHVANLIDFKFLYLAFSLISFSSVLFVHFCLPESKGKSLLEIEEYFRQRNQRDQQREI